MALLDGGESPSPILSGLDTIDVDERLIKDFKVTLEELINDKSSSY